MHLGLDCLLGERIIQNGMLDVKGGHLSSDWPSQNEQLDWLDPKNDGFFPEAPSTRYLCFLGLELVN